MAKSATNVTVAQRIAGLDPLSLSILPSLSPIESPAVVTCPGLSLRSDP